MWLINTTTLELHEFIDARHAPNYAILSHCWGDAELSFKDFRKKRNRAGPGYQKIVRCCKYAREVGYRDESLAWVCVDKRSSAELSEAINSMFDWYARARICYTYLADVQHGLSSSEATGEAFTGTFLQSRWFRRGWTLQELLAPAQVLFLNADWDDIGWKHNDHEPTQLTHAVASITGIPVAALIDPVFVFRRGWSVAQRMSWASRRSTTRKEDEAYCLFGLFNINMPLLYGEGPQAFQRLQHEILRQELGESLFAWERLSGRNSVFASRPSDFAGGADVIEVPTRDALIVSKGKGFELKIGASTANDVYADSSGHNLVVLLGCERFVGEQYADVQRQPCVIFLRYNDQCGHFYVTQPKSDSGVNQHGSADSQGERELAVGGEYRPIVAHGNVYIHANHLEKNICSQHFTDMPSWRTAMDRWPPEHGGHAFEDAL